MFEKSKKVGYKNLVGKSGEIPALGHIIIYPVKHNCFIAAVLTNIPELERESRNNKRENCRPFYNLSSKWFCRNVPCDISHYKIAFGGKNTPPISPLSHITPPILQDWKKTREKPRDWLLSASRGAN